MNGNRINDIFYFTTFLVCVPLLNFALFNQPYDEIILRKFKGLYIDGIPIKNKKLNKFNFIILESVFQAYVTITFAVYIEDARTKTG